MITVAEYTQSVDVITQPAEEAIALLRKKAEESTALGDIYFQMEQEIRSKVKNQVSELTNDLIKSLIGTDDTEAEDGGTE